MNTSFILHNIVTLTGNTAYTGNIVTLTGNTPYTGNIVTLTGNIIALTDNTAYTGTVLESIKQYMTDCRDRSRVVVGFISNTSCVTSIPPRHDAKSLTVDHNGCRC